MDNSERRTDNAGKFLGAVSAEASATNRDPAPKTASAVETSSLVSLKSLAPRYDEAQHGSYLGRLERAVQDPKSRNIALSGPYGTGKSSVLDKFEESHKNSTLRLAISTLAPDAEVASLTNRIQKELVKQLVYSASPGTLKHSRFGRTIPHLAPPNRCAKCTRARPRRRAHPRNLRPRPLRTAAEEVKQPRLRR